MIPEQSRLLRTGQEYTPTQETSSQQHWFRINDVVGHIFSFLTTGYGEREFETYSLKLSSINQRCFVSLEGRRNEIITEMSRRILRRDVQKIQSAPEAVKNNPEFLLITFGLKPNLLSFSPFSGDKKFALKLLEKNGLALEFCSEELRDNKTVVLKAVKQNGLALKYASERLRKDQNVILEAISSNPESRQFIDPNFEKLHKDLLDKETEKVRQSYNDFWLW